MRKTFPDIIVCILIISLTLAVFWEVNHSDFINYDDDVYVTENSNIQSGINGKSVTWAFTTNHAGFWIPMTWISFMLDFELHGLVPGGYHLTNLILHICNALLLYILLRRMTGSLWRSGFVALVFAVHPLHVESVAWVTERKDVLSTFFFMMALLTYFHYAKGPNLWKYVLVVFFFILALMSKPMIVTLPLVLLLMDFWPLGRLHLNEEENRGYLNGYKGRAVVLVEKIPFFLLSIACTVITYIAHRNIGAVSAVEVIPLKVRLLNALDSYAAYIVKLLWPADLAIYYPYPEILNLWTSLGNLFFLALISLAVIGYSRIRPYFLVGWLWYLITLLPVIGIIQAGGQAMADRFVYVPFVGLFIMIAWGTGDLVKGRRVLKPTSIALAGACLVALGMMSWHQVRLWKDNLTLYGHTLNVTKRNALVHNNYGSALADLGRFREAKVHFEEAVKIMPGYTKARYNLAAALCVEGKNEEAAGHLEEALRLDPGFEKARKKLKEIEAQGIGLKKRQG